MSQLCIDKGFLREYAKLEKPVQDRVTEVFTKFEHDPHSGQNLEKITGARDDRLRTIRINDFWRGVVLAPDTGDSYTLLKVMRHDEAINWAKRRTVSVNTATGQIELRDSVAIEDTLPALSQGAEHTHTLLFDGVKDSTLRQLGIDGQTREFAAALTDLTQLEAAKGFLPSRQWDVLYGLAAGYSPEEVWAELGVVAAEQDYDPHDIDAAVARSADRMVLVNGPEELMAVFAHPFALWRIYLHPLQRGVVEASYRGPARVTGGPGTGKTVVALHRAQHLAQNGAGPVLVTTFTSTLGQSLSAGVALLVDDANVAEHIEVAHVDRLAHRIFRQEHGAPRMLEHDAETAMWNAIIERLELPFTATFLEQEWRRVILAQEIGTAQEYLSADRAGRGRRLGSRQKAQVWQAVWAFTEEMREHGLVTHGTVRVEATNILRQRDEKPYRHIVVDEAQDLDPTQWRLLRAAAPTDRDDIFLAGDTHQRIYHSRVSLLEVGIRVTGRSSKLKMNYRTTAEILAWSLSLLRGESIDDMDDDLDSIAGCRSDVHGSLPRMHGFSSMDAELDQLATTVREWLDSGVELDEIGVAARSNRLAQRVAHSLTSHGVSADVLRGGQRVEGAVSVGTMHRMKGLEFRCLAVVGVGEHQVPPTSAITAAEEDNTTHKRDMQRERCLLFVACTRAREQLSVSWHGAPSQFLEAVN